MRRIAPLALGLTLATAFGCGASRPYRNVGVGRAGYDPAVVQGSYQPEGAEPLDEAQPATGSRFSREAVGDAEMLRNQRLNSVNDSPVPY